MADWLHDARDAINGGMCLTEAHERVVLPIDPYVTLRNLADGLRWLTTARHIYYGQDWPDVDTYGGEWT